MLKLYFKKLLMTVLFAVGYFLTVGCLGFFSFLLILSILPIQKLISETTLTIIFAILALVIMLVVVYRGRSNNKPYKREYLEQIQYAPPSFGKDFWLTLKSKENICHTLAFLTVDFLFSAPIGISESSTLWVFIFGMLMLLISQGIIFTLINTLLWCLVHRRWSNYWRYAGYMTDRFEK